MVGKGGNKGQQLSVAKVNANLQMVEEDFSGLVKLVVGQGTEKEKQLPPPKIAQTLVELGYIPADYLFNVPRPHQDPDLIRFSSSQRYLLEWTRRACAYANPPTPENVRLFLSTLGDVSREAVRLELEKNAGFQLGAPYLPDAVKKNIVEQGLWMIRKAVEAPSLLAGLEIQISSQAALIEAVAQIFGGTIRRLAQEDLYKTVNRLRDAFVKSDNLLGLRSQGVDEMRAVYQRLTAQLGDPLPFKRLPQFRSG